MRKYSVQLPPHSEFLTSSDYKQCGGVIVPYYDRCYHCPLPSCERGFGNRTLLQTHLTEQHLRNDKPQVVVTDPTQVVPVQGLSNTQIVVSRTTRQAVCLASKVVLKRDQIANHIYTCPGCRQWDRPYQFPRLHDTCVSIPDHNLATGKSSVMLVKLPNSRVLKPLDAVFAPHDHVRADHVGLGGIGLTTAVKCYVYINEVVSSPPSSPKPLEPDHFTTVVRKFVERLDMATNGLQRSVIDRIGIKNWADCGREDEVCNDYWFGNEVRNNLQLLPYALHEAIQFESVLENMPIQSLASEKNAAKLRMQLTATIDLLLRLIGCPVKPRDDFGYGKHRKIVFENGKMYAYGNLVPWCVAEMVARYMVVVRPMVNKLDRYFAHRPKMLFPYVQYSNANRHAILELVECRRSRSFTPITEAADRWLLGNGPCLVEHYTTKKSVLLQAFYAR